MVIGGLYRTVKAQEKKRAGGGWRPITRLKVAAGGPRKGLPVFQRPFSESRSDKPMCLPLERKEKGWVS